MTTTSNYALRLQKSLLEEVKRIAAEENTTINQFINVAVAEKPRRCAPRRTFANTPGVLISPTSIGSWRRPGPSRRARGTNLPSIRMANLKARLEGHDSGKLVIDPNLSPRLRCGSCRRSTNRRCSHGQVVLVDLRDRGHAASRSTEELAEGLDRCDELKRVGGEGAEAMVAVEGCGLVVLGVDHQGEDRDLRA